ETWRPGDPVPAPFAAPLEYTFVFDNWTFERAILERVLIPIHGFKTIPLENMDCAQQKALASAFPAELGLRCKALDSPYTKDPAARRAMLRLSRLHAYKDPAARERDLELLHARCVTDVESTRACYNHPRLRPLSPGERHLLLLDAAINARGVRANVPFLEATNALAVTERANFNTRLCELTGGTVTAVDQVARILKAVNACGHGMAKLNKRAVAAVLARDPDAFTREVLTLRQRGAFASALKPKQLLQYADPVDHRIRHALRFHGAGTGRWTSLGAQLHNLTRNDAELPATLIDALVAADHAKLGSDPLRAVSQLARAALCAAPGNVLVC